MASIQTTKELSANTFEKLKAVSGYKNVMQAPKLTKVVVSVGTGSFKDKNKNKVVEDRLAKITGQKPVTRGAKKAIANYKTRLNDVVGYQVTLRGPKMYGFLDKFLNIGLPRTKDFRGIDKKAVDNIGNITIGVKEHTIFPETADEDIKDTFGMAITIVSSAKNKKEAIEYFEYLGVPFKK